jgi:hypothetical protein
MKYPIPELSEVLLKVDLLFEDQAFLDLSTLVIFPEGIFLLLICNLQPLFILQQAFDQLA